MLTEAVIRNRISSIMLFMTFLFNFLHKVHFVLVREVFQLQEHFSYGKLQCIQAVCNFIHIFFPYIRKDSYSWRHISMK